MHLKSRFNPHSHKSPKVNQKPRQSDPNDVIKTIMKKSSHLLLEPPSCCSQECLFLKSSQTHSCRDSTREKAQKSPIPVKSKLLATSMTLSLNPYHDQLKNKIQENKKIVERIKNKHLKNQKAKEVFPKNVTSQHFLLSQKTLECQKNSVKTSDNSPKKKMITEATFEQKGLKTCLTETKLKEGDHYLTLKFNGKVQLFDKLKYLDQGAFGKVYLVQHITTGMIICLKIIQKCQLDEEDLKNIIREIKVQSSLNHPNILNLYGYTSDAENVYLLLEPCLGSNAYKKLSNDKVPEKEVRKSIKEICSAVEYLHKKDVIHRDIKAENVLFHEGTAKLCDFGWAVHAPQLRNTQCGTPLYSPPQMVKNECYDSKVDLWCIGILTYEMLYGTSPFEIRHISDLVKIVEERVFFSKGVHVTEEAQSFIEGCLSKNPFTRLNIRQALEHDFLTTKIEHFRHTMA